MDIRIPTYAFRHVPHSARQDLADMLDPDSCFQLSWKFFAEKLNRYFKENIFSPIKIKAIDDRRGSSTLAVLDILAQGNVITTDIVQEVLLEMHSAAADVLPRYISEIATNASNETCHVIREGNPHSCHCQSCIHYCDSIPHRQDIHQHCRRGHLHQVHPERQTSVQPGQNYTNNNHLEQCIARNQIIENENKNILQSRSQRICVPIEIHRFHDGSEYRHINNSLNNINLETHRVQNNSLQNVTDQVSRLHIDNRPNKVRSVNQNISPDISTSNNITTTRHTSTNASSAVERQNVSSDQAQGMSEIPVDEPQQQGITLRPTREHSIGPANRIFDDWIPPDSDCESDSDLFEPEPVTEETELTGLYQRTDGTLSNNEINIEEKCYTLSKVEQCTCEPQSIEKEHNRYSVPVTNDQHHKIDRKCYSDSDIDQYMPRKTVELMCTCRQMQKKKKIFTSYAMNDTQHFKEVFELQKQLFETKNYIVKADFNEGTFRKRMENSHDWLQNEFETADYVIFCISPLYNEYTKPNKSKNYEVEPDNSRLHVRFIFDLARTEYIKNSSRNKRFLPVLFQSSGAKKDHLPTFMCSTIWYQYPQDIDKLLAFLEQNSNEEIQW